LLNEYGEVIGMIGGSLLPGGLSDGQFMPPLVSTQSVLSGVLARSVNKKTTPPQPIEERLTSFRIQSGT
jgi:hypothetical protein